MDEKLYLIPESLANEILNYLADRPFRQVAGMVAGLQRIVPADASDPSPDDLPVEESLPAE